MDFGGAIAIVTARGGSKRIPGKNIRSFHGKPLIAWTIENLLESQLFSQVIITSESPEIIAIAESAGAIAPFIRPAKLADDFSTTAEVANHAIGELEKTGVATANHYCVVYPAAVAITKGDLTKSRELMREGNFDLVFAGQKVRASPYRSWKLGPGGQVTPLYPDKQSARTQDSEPLYQDAGQFYWSLPDSWKRVMRGETIRRGMWEVPRSRVIDIDDEEDWKIAEALFSYAKLHEKK